MIVAALEAVLLLVFLGGILLASAGRTDWPMAWAFIGVWGAFTALGFLLIDPQLIKERSRRAVPGVRRWDRVLAPLMFLWLMAAPLLVAGLDERFGWSPDLPPALRIAAFAVFVSGLSLAFWAEVTNHFFSTWARIQPERGHHVVTNGPYAYLRHPGYAGSLLSFLALQPSLGSLWSLVPAAAGAILLAIRTRFEDGMLRQELGGYSEYAARVRWRLVPGVW